LNKTNKHVASNIRVLKCEIWFQQIFKIYH